MANTESLQTLHEFIKAHRSNEIHFEVLNHKLEETYSWAKNKGTHQHLSEALEEIKEKQAAAYKVSREHSSSDWPQFEQFVQAFERSVVDALKER